jgi:hypothetical protein
MNRIIFFPYILKEPDIKELTNGILSLSDFYTNTQEFNNKYTDYNGGRYGIICQDEPTEIFDGIMIDDLEVNTVRTLIKNPGTSGGFTVTVDVSSCPTNRSKLYFAFQLFRDNCEISRFNRRDITTTPQKKHRVL